MTYDYLHLFLYKIRPTLQFMPRVETPHEWASIIFELRRVLLLTQRVFGDLFDITVTTVSNWECGRSVPQLRHHRKLHALARKAGMDSAAWPWRQPGLRAVSGASDPV